MDKSLKDKLKKAQAVWKGGGAQKARESKGGFTEVEDGRYIARLTGVEIVEAKSTSRLQAAWSYKILEGDYKGERVMNFDGLETEQNQMFFGKNIARFGYEIPDDLEQVAEILKELTEAKPLVKIRLKTKGEFQNVYVDAVYSQEDEQEVLSDAATEGSEEEPAEESAEEEAAEEEETPAEEEEEVPAEEEEVVALEVGMKVIVTDPKNPKTRRAGVVREVLEDSDKVKVLMADTKKIATVATDVLELDEEEAVPDAEEDIPEEPAKPAPKAAAKKKK